MENLEKSKPEERSWKMNNNNIDEEHVELYRGLVRSYINKMEFSTAVYWANKVVSFSSGEQQDVYLLAQCLCFSGQYLRAAHCLLYWKYERTNLYFRCLYAKCLYLAKDYNKALMILDLEHKDVLHHCQKSAESYWEPSDPRKTIMAEIHLLLGKIYAALMNRGRAIENYKKCLEHDIYCQEAFQLLSQHQMKTQCEIQHLAEELRFSQSCLRDDGDFIQKLYTCPEHLVEEIHDNPLFASLSENADILTAKAEHYLNGGFTQKAFKIASKVNTMDPFHPTGLSILVACQVELKMGVELFKTSHKLIEVMPTSAIAWYSVGAYYYDRGSQELARANLNKAISIDPVFGPAWLLFGHSFAADNEHDQAMAAYFKASQLMKGSHLPFLYGGVECARTKNTDMALEFLKDALKLAPNDPFIHNEIGVILFYDSEYPSAYKHFRKAENILAKCEEGKFCIDKWEPLYSNLGHCYRKLRNVKDSIKYHQKALSLRPNNFQSYSAIGSVYAMNDEYEKASDYFHKALSINRDDAFSNAMLRIVIEMFPEDPENDEGLEFSDDEDGESLYFFPEMESCNLKADPTGEGDIEVDADCETTWFQKACKRLVGNSYHAPLTAPSLSFDSKSTSVSTQTDTDEESTHWQ